ncbi:hypothetical protein SAMN03159338_4285 [Sphingomonas sp. NFR04]|uniref:hypothetical protein n=1 Tax=Sphingomonas sp. NFR04 TaxID=1566283 RepID=UPI0008E1F806|nr:hypothetical protein [Sphingomonas sp. NFR04]SFK44832.1 hypothetical protein SAMN03159338_4285 [Sphingomonas sp. NFR04]
MTDDPKLIGPPPAEGNRFRAAVGIAALSAGLLGLILLFFVEIPPRNENAVLLALGIVLGWGGSVVQSEYGASTTGRKAADLALRKAGER